MSGFAVVDIRTTGLHPGQGRRVIEVAVVHVSDQGSVIGHWDTLVDPRTEFALHPVHGVDPVEVLNAPAFDDIAGRLIGLLEDRVLVAHNHLFTARFLDSEFRHAGYLVPVSGLCVMGMGWHYVGATRSLAACCRSLGIERGAEHRALVDAQAAAGLLVRYLEADPTAAFWEVARTQVEGWSWPERSSSEVEWRPRECAGGSADHFLAHLVGLLPDPALSEHSSLYLATLDRALVDRCLSVAETAALREVAVELQLGQIEAATLHAMFLRDLAVAAWTDGEVTEEQRTDLHTVGHLLGFGTTDVDNALLEASPTDAAIPVPAQEQTVTLAVGDHIVFAGELSGPQNELADLAKSVGLVPQASVTRRIALVIASDPTSPSEQVQKARRYGIRVVTEETFRRVIHGGVSPAGENPKG